MNLEGPASTQCRRRHRRGAVLVGAGACLGVGLSIGYMPRLDEVGSRVATYLDEQGGSVAAAPRPVELVWTQDTDGDGLYDTTERLLGTDSAVRDSDGDDCSDLYELAAFSDPLNGSNTPAGTYFVRPFAYQYDLQTLRFSFLVFEPSGRMPSVLDRWGLIYREQWEDASPYLPMLRFVRRIDRSQLGDAAPANSAVFEVGYNTPRRMFVDQDPNYLGWHLYFSANWGQSLLHGVFNLRQVRGELVETVFATTPGTGGGGQLGAGFATFRPFDAGGAEAGGWQPNRACVLYLSSSAYQQRETGLAWFPVTSATCEPLSFAFCSPGCTSTEWSIQSGQAVRVLDPFALAGL